MPVKYRKNKGIKTISRTLRMSKELDDRITDLALKSLTTKTNWIIKCLEQKAYRHKDKPLEINPSASGEGEK